MNRIGMVGLAGRWKRLRCGGRNGLLAALLLVGRVGSGASGDPAGGDAIEWSDGQRWQGLVRLAGGDTLQVQDDRTLRRIPLSEVAEIRWQIETQRMERAWHFPEAGRTGKVEHGDPYPVRYWRVGVRLHNDAELSGRLITAAFYLEAEGETQKLLVRRKQRGAPGQTFEDLVSPVRMRFARRLPLADDDGAPASRRAAMDLRFEPRPDAGATVGAVMLDPLSALHVEPLAEGAFRLHRPDRRMVVGLRSGNRIHAGWVDHGPPGLRERLENATRELSDFFDDRRLLGYMADPLDSERALSLMLLLRRGATTLDDPRPLPWRLEVWSWRLGADPAVLLAGRAVLFRDRRAAVDAEPDVIPVAAWLRVDFADEVLTLPLP